MQKTKLILIALVLGGTSLWAQTQPAPSRPGQPSAYEQARESYVNAALVQVQAYRKQIDAAAKAAPSGHEQERFAEPNRLLKDLELLISRLRSAPPSEFDAVKADYERTRVRLDQSLGRSP
jgi:hypothetical protein